MQKAETQQAETQTLDTKKLLGDAVDRTITVKLPKQFDEYLQILAKGLGRTVEKILLEDMYSVLDNFFSGGHNQAWIESVVSIDNERDKQLEKQIQQIGDLMCDC